MSSSSWSILRERDFSLFLTGRFCASVAQQITDIAVGWLVYDLTGSALALGLVGLAAFLPVISLVLVTGHVADRVDRRLIMMGCFTLNTLICIGLALFAIWHPPDVWPLYALVVLMGVARAFYQPASQAFVPNLVPRSLFGQAIAWSSSVTQVAVIAGPAIGGLLYIAGAYVAFGGAALLFLVAAVAVTLIRLRAEKVPRPKIDWPTLIAGLTFIRGKPVLFGAISLDLFGVLLGGATALLPIYASDILHIGPAGLGLLRSAPAVGAAMMGLYLAQHPIARHAGKRMFGAVILFGLATIVFGLSTNFFLSLAALVVLGVADMVSVFVRQTLVQAETPDTMRGRVAAVNTVFIGASNQLGEFESGTLAAFIGAAPAVALGGVGTIAIALLWTRLFPALLHRDKLVE
ncbi:MFS transporter [Chelatococcus asaccharovorans]|uniref:Putative MFS family arabinose efflux permease n=1 Tax=Chelatococcus asaccharovorans TaxID=28210 RepID=A0A2V3U0H5_9HYPH|nr:MFS transporter [Chelatococcus asaccharovorans]MBS7704472.1 MFS transporter [Chelatococcus asaccharovorans]PXW55647.1 putative MFS family arabinose efflux permease [Chelatococcus asaccharovorans]